MLAVALAGLVAARSADLPPPVDRKVDFASEVLPILETSCLRCHGAERPKGGRRLDTREAALRPGDYGPVILPGRSEESPFIHFVAGLEDGMEMPPVGQGEPLTAEQVSVLRAWIDQGAEWSSSFTPSRSMTLGGGVQWIGVEGNSQQFRMHTFTDDGWSGGVSEFDWLELPDPDTRLRVRGRGWLNQGDFDIRMELHRRDLGFVEVEAETWRKYYDEQGGYVPAYGGAPSVGTELETTHGRAEITLGLRRPRWPELTVGYEYTWKHGDQSSLAWGVYSPDPFVDPGKAIVPGTVAIEESRHLVSLEVLYPWETGSVQDNLWLELYDRSTRSAYAGDGSPDILGRYEEDYDHREVVNVLRAEQQIRPWLLASGGYLFSRLEGDGAAGQGLESLTGAFPPFPGDEAPTVSLQQQSHTLNGNAQAGPWGGLRLFGGVQSEWLDQEGLGALVTPGFPNPSQGRNFSQVNRLTMDETAGLQYDRIPFTVLYAEGRWQQRWTDQVESSLIDDGFADSRDFDRQTDASDTVQRYVSGLTVSPWARTSLDLSYRWESRDSDYEHGLDENGAFDPAESGNGYPAFIRGRVVEGQEAEARLAWRAARWLRWGFKYTYGMRDYRSDTDPSLLPAFPTPIFYPGGHILAGEETAHSGTATVSVQPWRRLSLTASFTYTRSSLDTALSDGVIVAPYEGRVVSVLSTATWVVANPTDLRITYSFSDGDYDPQELPEGLPLGMRYTRHGLVPALVHRLNDRVTATLRYGFFDYTEPTLGGAHDYRAHWVTAGLTWVLN